MSVHCKAVSLDWLLEIAFSKRVSILARLFFNPIGPGATNLPAIKEPEGLILLKSNSGLGVPSIK